jgi:hypothetical protein
VRRLQALAVVCSILAGAGDARAQEGNYGATISSALSEFEEGRYAEARALFLRAHELQPSARTQRGIGMAAFEMRAYADATRALSAALVETRRPLDGPQRTQVQALLDRAVGFVGRFTLTMDPPTAALLIDGRPATLEPDGTLMLEIGSHTITATAPGRSDFSLPLEVRGGEQRPLEITLTPAMPAPLDTPPPTPVAPSPDPQRDAPTDDGGGGSLRLIAFTGAGVLAAGAIVTTLAWWLERGSAIDRCEAAGARCLNLDDLRGQRTLAMVTTLGLAAGAVVLLVVGLVSGGGGDAEAERAVACGPTGCTVWF